MFEKKKPLRDQKPYKTSADPLKDRIDYHGKGKTVEEIREQVMEKIHHLERIKENYIKQGHSELIKAISDEQKELRELLTELEGKE